MTEQDYFNDYENDAERFKNFCKLIIVVDAIITAMIYINL